MDKNAENMINELERRIETLQAKRDAVIKKEKERKTRAQEKWKSVFWKEFSKGAVSVFGEDYEEVVLPEVLAGQMAQLLPSLSGYAEEPAEKTPEGEPAGETNAQDNAKAGEKSGKGEDTV